MLVRRMVIAIVVLFSATSIVVAESNSTREWNFRVLLNDKAIGTHRFVLEEEGDRLRLESNATFDVRFLFFNAYRYRHTNREVWDGSCLQSLLTDTVVNGDKTNVVGERDGNGFLVRSNGNEQRLDGCVMTFAYWDASLLERSMLLNAQTGEYLDVEISEAAAESFTVRGRPQPADRYRITAKELQIDVWYTSDKQWLGLESLTEGGRVIRYELT